MASKSVAGIYIPGYVLGADLSEADSDFIKSALGGLNEVPEMTPVTETDLVPGEQITPEA
jgi:hypothetical protein